MYDVNLLKNMARDILYLDYSEISQRYIVNLNIVGPRYSMKLIEKR